MPLHALNLSKTGCHPGLEPGPIPRSLPSRKVAVLIPTTSRLLTHLKLDPGSRPGWHRVWGGNRVDWFCSEM